MLNYGAPRRFLLITALVQRIFDLVIVGVESDEWETIEFQYKADDSQSEYTGWYVVGEDKQYFRARRLSSQQKTELSELLRALRTDVDDVGGEPFTHCTLSYASNGDFQMDVNYKPIDWSATT